MNQTAEEPNTTTQVDERISGWAEAELKTTERTLADAVNSPAHYTHGSIETIAVIEDWQLGFHAGNALKYISRAGRKDPAREIEDYRKAIWYLERLVALKERVNGRRVVAGAVRSSFDVRPDGSVLEVFK